MNCFDEAVIQEYLDGELSREAAENVAMHSAECRMCADLIEAVEAENQFLRESFSAALDAPVRSEVIWRGVQAHIAKDGAHRHGVFARFAALFTMPQLGFGFAALILALFGAYFAFRPVEVQIVTNPEKPVTIETPKKELIQVPLVGKNKADDASIENRPFESVKPVLAIAKNESAARVPKTRSREVSIQNAVVATSFGQKYVKGEREYLMKIRELEELTADKKNAVMRPSQIVVYEKGMAELDTAIEAVRTQVRKNPKDDAARKVLFNSYQNKIEMLNSVAARENTSFDLR